MSDNIVVFGNPGFIDPRVWSTFGVSAKNGDDPIGQFGTGLKYAIAVLMRECRSMRIVSGDYEYVFGVKDTKIRDAEFQQITCNGEAMPYTTHLGAKWELWQAYRELYSNCLDEGGGIGRDGDTCIYAEIGDIDHDSVFLNKDGRRLLSSSTSCDVYAGGSPHIYYRGIRVADINRESLFTYDLKCADLTEDRTLKYHFQLDKGISDAILQSDDDDLVLPFLLHSKGFHEESVDFDYSHHTPSKRILEIVKRHRKDGLYMQKGLLNKAASQLGGEVYDQKPMDQWQSMVVDKASDFCASIGYPINFPVHLSDSLGNDTLALACRKTNTIYLSDTVLSQGTKQVASALIEEQIHLSKGLDDCTYKMQSYLFDQIVTLGERLTGEIL